MIPFQNQALFWDVRPEDIDTVKHKRWLIERVAQWGTYEDILQLLKVYSPAEIQTVIANSRAVDARTSLFWETVGRRMEMYENVLPDKTQEIWDRIAELASSHNFVLVGGTALALRLGHRESEDLDLFTNRHFASDKLVANLNSMLADGDRLEIVSKEREDTLHIRYNEVKISFLYQAGEHLQEFELWRGMAIASQNAIIAMKLNAVAGRGERKDFVDLYAVCQAGLSFEKMLLSGFPLLPNLNRYHVLRSLTYFEDAEETPPLRLFREYSWEEIKRFFREQTRHYLLGKEE